MPYSEETDLLIGDMPLPKGLRPQKYVDDGADEIDSVIGFIYVTPVNIDGDSTPVVRPVRLLLKRLNNMLASGRMIMAMTTGGQRQELHAYGASLVREAVAVLKQIADGEILLEGAERVGNDEDPNDQFTGPQVFNLDGESNVESFYDRIANPAYCFGPGYIPYNSNGLVA